MPLSLVQSESHFAKFRREREARQRQKHGSSGACGPNQRQRLKGNHVERNNEPTGPCAIWLPAALLSDFPAGGIYQAILRGARGVYWIYFTIVDAGITAPNWIKLDFWCDSTRLNHQQKTAKSGGPSFAYWSYWSKIGCFQDDPPHGGLRSSSLAKGGKVGIPSLELEELGTQTVHIGDLTMLHSPYNVGPPR